MIRHIATTRSTNDDMAALARQGAAEGTWLRADAQQGGRGRQGRQWVSPPGNLHASTLVRRMAGDPPAPTLALVAALALDGLLQAWLGPDRLMVEISEQGEGRLATVSGAGRWEQLIDHVRL